MKQILRYLLAFVGILVTFNLLLTVTSLFPSSLIEDSIQESAEILMQEGNDYRLSEIFAVSNNNFTDSIILNAAYSIDNENPIYSYMVARKNYKKGLTIKELEDSKGEYLYSVSPNEGEEFTESYDPVR